MTIQVWYHANCLDGSGSAWAASKQLGLFNVQYIPVQYGNPTPPFNEEDEIYILDFSYDFDTLKAIALSVRKLVILDHHKSSKDACAKLDALGLKNVYVKHSSLNSGAVLTWKYFFPLKDVPPGLRYIEDRDLWKFMLEGTKDFCASLAADGKDQWIDWLPLNTHWIQERKAEGKAIIKFLTTQREVILRNQQLISWRGYDVILINLPGFMISETLNEALQLFPEADFAVAFFDLPLQDKRVYSLRSTNTQLDVSEIAEKFGGGGHRNAAGFSEAY